MAKEKFLRFRERLEKNKTNSEVLFNKTLECILDFTGVHFETNHIVQVSKDRCFYIDFYIPELYLGFEIDGKIHEGRDNYDTKRDILLAEKNILICRFKNEEIKTKKTLQKIINIKPRLPDLLSCYMKIMDTKNQHIGCCDFESFKSVIHNNSKMVMQILNNAHV